MKLEALSTGIINVEQVQFIEPTGTQDVFKVTFVHGAWKNIHSTDVSYLAGKYGFDIQEIPKPEFEMIQPDLIEVENPDEDEMAK